MLLVNTNFKNKNTVHLLMHGVRFVNTNICSVKLKCAVNNVEKHINVIKDYTDKVVVGK